MPASGQTWGVAMIVRSYGFSVTPGNKEIGLDALFESLEKTSGAADTSLSNLRRIYVNTASDPNFVIGLVVTVKDQKTFCELVNDKGNFVITVSNLKGKNKLMEFNFFLVNKANGLGIYQHYFHSCSPNTFGSYLRRRYRRLSDSSQDATIQAMKNAGEHTLKKEKQVKSAHAKALSFGLLVHKDSLAKVLSRYKEIKAFEYEYAALEPDLIKGVPLGNYIKRLRQKVSFKPNVGVDILSNAIQATVDMIQPRSGHVSVIDEVDDEDIPMSIRIAGIPEHFGENDYDAVAGDLNNLDVTKFADHKVVKELIKAGKETHAHVFMKKIKEAHK